MYICLCNGLTDRQVREAARKSSGTLAQAHRSLGVRVQCGKCLPAMREILRDPLCDLLNEKAATAPAAGN
jgi:bacterioferritin-associated ferredoxin